MTGLCGGCKKIVVDGGGAAASNAGKPHKGGLSGSFLGVRA